MLKNIDKKFISDKKNMFFGKKSIKLCSKFSSNVSKKCNDGDKKSNLSSIKSSITSAAPTSTQTHISDETHATATIDLKKNNDVSNVKTVAITVKNKNKSSPNKSNNNNNRNSGNLKLSYNNLIASLLRTTTL